MNNSYTKTVMKMKIKRFIKSKRNIYILEIDNQKIPLYDDIITKYSLLMRKEISNEELSSIIHENRTLDSYYDSLNYMNKKMRTHKEISQYLRKKEYDQDTIHQTIQKLYQNHLLNDKQYAQIFIGDAIRLTSDGPSKIAHKLDDLGISSTDYEEDLLAISKDIWDTKIDTIINKRMHANHKDSALVFKKKLASYLQACGYPHSLSDSHMDNMTLPNSNETLLKNYHQLYTRLSRKYSGHELDFQIKMKLLQKGYSNEEIESIKKTD